MKKLFLLGMAIIAYCIESSAQTASKWQGHGQDYDAHARTEGS